MYKQCETGVIFKKQDFYISTRMFQKCETVVVFKKQKQVYLSICYTCVPSYLLAAPGSSLADVSC